MPEKIPVPGTDTPSPASRPMATSPDKHFLYAQLRSEPYPVSTFAIDRTTGRLKHLAATPLVGGFIERNAIGLLSNYGRAALDPPSADWLGHASNRARVLGSGLWNQRHVDETYDPSFLNTFEMMIAKITPS